jgi:DnaJ-class molecular chaperone
MYRTWENLIKDSIHNDGKKEDIHYDSVSTCLYCGVNPITGESIRPSCATCGGTGYQTTTSTCYITGVVNTFINNKGYIQFGQENLKNTHSITGATYLDSAKSVTIEGSNYYIKNYQRIGIENVKVCVVILDRIK